MTGAITINTATVRINSDDAAGTLAINGGVGMGANNLTVGGVGATTIGGVITGSGTLTKDGAGVLTVTGEQRCHADRPDHRDGGDGQHLRLDRSGPDRSRDAQRRDATADRNLGSCFSSTTRGIDPSASGGTIEISNAAGTIDYAGVIGGAEFSIRPAPAR